MSYVLDVKPILFIKQHIELILLTKSHLNPCKESTYVYKRDFKNTILLVIKS